MLVEEVVTNLNQLRRERREYETVAVLMCR